MKTFLFELCGESLEAAKTAEAGGVDRIELCAELRIGGVTPDFELTRATVEAVSIPVHVLIRPRGGDFVYSADEYARMRLQIEQAREAGAKGVVLGILLPNGHVDMERTRVLVQQARPMAVTFHRAFDETPDLSEALESVIETGADCLLTSGGAAEVLSGAETIAGLARRAGKRIQIMAGGGLWLRDVAEVMKRSGVTHLHGSLTRKNGKQKPALLLESDVREAVRTMREAATQETTQVATAHSYTTHS
jgi:copper homeostasis protein